MSRGGQGENRSGNGNGDDAHGVCDSVARATENHGGKSQVTQTVNESVNDGMAGLHEATVTLASANANGVTETAEMRTDTTGHHQTADEAVTENGTLIVTAIDTEIGNATNATTDAFLGIDVNGSVCASGGNGGNGGSCMTRMTSAADLQWSSRPWDRC